MIDKNCWIELFDDTKYDADPHGKVQGSQEHASLKNLDGETWNHDNQGVNVGFDAPVKHHSFLHLRCM